MTDNDEEAEFLAEQVEFFNQERKDIVAQITEEVSTILDATMPSTPSCQSACAKSKNFVPCLT
jgi:single-stranded DNA-specific DHH superfamily exonuclease